MTSPASVWVRPLSMALLRCTASWATCPRAIRALTVTRLRSRGARSGRNHTSRNSGGVRHEAGGKGLELLSDLRRAGGLPALIEREQSGRCCGQLVGRDVVPGKNLSSDASGRRRARDTGVEGEVSDDF